MNRKAKKNIKRIGIILIGCLAILIFFSKTIYNINLPIVTASMPKSGNLVKNENTNGIVKWANEENLYSSNSGKIKELFVKEGDRVKKGDKLVSFNYDIDDLNTRLAKQKLSRQKVLIDIEESRTKRAKIAADIKETDKDLKNIENSTKMKQLKDKIDKAQKDLEKNKPLYEQGAISKDDYQAKKNELDSLVKECENTRKTEKVRLQKQLKDYRYELNSIDRDLKRKNIDLNSYDIEEKTIVSELNEYNNNTVVIAPSDGEVLSLPIEKGQVVNKNDKVLKLGIGTEYKIECDVNKDNNFVAVGDTCRMSNSTNRIKGEVSSVNIGDNSKKVVITFNSDKVSVGETLDINFEKKGTETFTIVPNGAINKDTNGYFLYSIKKRKGILGEEYYAEKLKVRIGDSDNENTIITKGIDFYDPIVLLSDKAIKENMTIKVKNEGDFFEKG